MTNVPEWDLPGNSGVAEQLREAADRNALLESRDTIFPFCMDVSYLDVSGSVLQFS